MGALLVLGAGGHGRVVAEAALASGFDRVVFLDDRPPGAPGLGPVIGPFSALAQMKADWPAAIVAIGDNRSRLGMFAELGAFGFETPSVIHPAAVVSSHAHLGSGVFAAAGSIVSVGARIGDAAILNTAATVDHDCIVSAGAHISPGANLAGNVVVGTCAWIGIGAAVKNGVNIGSDAIVGAGSAVIKDVEADAVVAGAPARAIS